jgi:hypothetical protein
MNTVLSESEFQEKLIQIYKEEQYKVIEEKWNSLTKDDKLFVVEMLKQVYPKKAKLLSEAKWYNTVGDVLGIVDPTGIVDFANGVSYWRQGDKLYALLSWISVFPYIGDLIAKPVIGLFKTGGATTKAFKSAVAAGDVAKIASTAKKSPVLGKFVVESPTWASKLLSALKNMIGKVPFVGKGFITLVEDYVKLFTSAGKEYKAASETAGKLLAKGESTLSKVEKQELSNALKKTNEFRGFRTAELTNPTFKHKWLSGGVGRLWGNRATRSMMRRTKWYLGLLDYLGVANFVGPEELEKQVENLDQKVLEYSETPKSDQLWQQEMGTLESPVATEVTPKITEPTKTESPLSSIDPFSMMLKGLIGI